MSKQPEQIPEKIKEQSLKHESWRKVISNMIHQLETVGVYYLANGSNEHRAIAALTDQGRDGLSHTVAVSDEMKKGLHDFATNIWAACMQTLINNSDRKPALSLNLKKFHKDQDRVIDKMVSETLAALAAHPEQHRE